MGRPQAPREVSLRSVSCLENLVVAYNTVFLMSSIFLVYIAATAHELFSDINRLLSPSLLLPIIGVFVVLLAGIGYVGIAKQSSTLISIYTQLLLFVFALEIAAGMGILSYRVEIRTMVGSKMMKAIQDYPDDPFKANMVDYVQLELRCCGVTHWRDWDQILEGRNYTDCQSEDIVLPASCCRKNVNSTLVINRRGCLPALSFFLHKSSILLSLGIMTISTIQILGAYFSYSLSSSLRKYKNQKARAYNTVVQAYYQRQERQTKGQEQSTIANEKSNYF